MIWSVNAFLRENVVLRGQHVELRVLESLVGILYFSQPIFHRFLLVGLLFEHSSLNQELPLQVGRFRIQSVVHDHLFSEGAVLPQADRACTNNSGAFEHSHLLVQVDFFSYVCQTDLPHLERHRDNKEGCSLVGVLLECGILAEVFILHGVI